MLFKEYIDFADICITELSERLEVSRPYLSAIIHQKKRAGRKLAKKIEIATIGKVTVNELRPKREKTI